jgi:hypothetical protein
MRTVLLAAAACVAACAQISVTSQMRSNAGRPTGNGIIEGSVLNEITREPMKKVPVVLMGLASLTAVTDTEGHFAFKDLAAGDYTIRAQAPNARFQRPGGRDVRTIHVGADEHVTDVSLTLTPPGSVSGRVLDDEGSPLQRCLVMITTKEKQRGARAMMQRGGSQSDASGYYHIDDVEPGRYYVMARCNQQTPLPHPLMERGSADIPMLRYAPLFYPAATSLTGATLISVAAGASVSGIDFRMTPAQGVAVKGRVTGVDAESMQGRVSVMLRPRGEVQFFGLDQAARFDPQTGIFQFNNVLPGSYDLTATADGGNQEFYTKVPLEIGSAPPEPLELTLAQLPAVNGTIRIEGDSPNPVQHMQVSLFPLQPPPMRMPSPASAQVKEDGTFHFDAVAPVKCQLAVNGPAYIKSVMLNDQEVSPAGFDVPPGSAVATLKIVLGTKWAQVDGAITGGSELQQGGRASGILWRDGDQGEMGQWNRGFFVDPQGHFNLQNIAPGKYHACAVASPEPWLLFQNPQFLEKLAGKCETVDLQEGAHATVQLSVIPREDLQKLSAEVDAP